MNTNLKDKIALVTGASRGIGRAISLSLARDGARVVAAARDAERLKSLSDESRTRAYSGSIEPCPLDVCDKARIEEAVEQIAARHQRVDILVNNAGITRDSLLPTMEDDQFEDVLTVNLRSVFWITRAVSRLMIRARWGRIIMVSSVSGISGNAGQSNYAATKAALIGFAKSAARELARRNITCNVVAPGFITTEMTDVLPDKVKETVKPLIPMQRFGSPEDIAEAVAFLVGPGAAYITGQVLVVDGGLKM